MTHGKNIGRIVWFDQKKGYGFVRVGEGTEEDKEVFFHFSSIQSVNSFKKVYPGEYVSLDIEENEKTEDPNKKYNGMNITGVNGGPLLVDNEEYLYRIIRKRNISKSEAVDGEQTQAEEDADTAAGVGDIEE